MAREMKDSGVAWIGEIPADWQIVKFSRIASVKCNLVAPDDYLELPQISPENIEKGSGKLLSYKTVEESGIISGNHLFHEGQLLYSKIRPKLMDCQPYVKHRFRQKSERCFCISSGHRDQKGPAHFPRFLHGGSAGCIPRRRALSLDRERAGG